MKYQCKNHCRWWLRTMAARPSITRLRPGVWPVAVLALAAGLISLSAQGSEFRIQLEETFICKITSDGGLEFSEEKGEVIYDRHVFPGDLGSFYPDWSVPHLLVQRAADGVIVARVDGNNHNMYVRGKVYREHADIEGPPSDADFLIKSGETTVARITDEGDLFLAGVIDPPLVIHHGIVRSTTM